MKVHVELGCGNNRRDIEGWENIGVDIVDGPSVDVICNLGFEDLPFNDNSIDLFQAYDVFEHIPKCVWSQTRDEDEIITQHVRHLPLIELMNEIYRCLKDDGKLITEIPISDWAFYRDPTHVSRFTDDWPHYFSKHDNLYYNQGVVRCDFEVKLQEKRYNQNTLYTEMSAIKSTKQIGEVLI